MSSDSISATCGGMCPPRNPCPGATDLSISDTNHNLSCGGTRNIKKVISERYTRAVRSMSSSPTPTKHARVDLVSTNYDQGNVSRVGCPESPMDTSSYVAHIKREPQDDTDKQRQAAKNEFYYLQDALSRARSNSLHSTTSPYPRKNRIDSALFQSTFTAHRAAEEPNCPSAVPERRPSTSLGFTKPSDDQPDSSTGSCEQLAGVGSSHHSSSSSFMLTNDCTSAHNPASTSTGNDEAVLCQVCGDLAAGFYCNAYICEACKKFFIRASKLERPRYVCLRQKNCVITKESRVHCQYCRYQKCLQLNMSYSKDGHRGANRVGVQEIPCRVCSAPSSGFHFGALTCEGCKGFFRRMVKEREPYSYKCSRSGKCDVNATTRNMCKACRYNKCLQIGMSVEGSRIGRQPNAVKHAISLEAKKQVALKTETDNTREGNTSPSSFNFESVILDPCLPGDMDDSLQSVDTHQDSASVDPLPSPSIKKEDARYKLEPSAPDSHDSCVSFSTEQHISSPTSQHHSDIFRIPHHILPLSSDAHSHHEDPYGSSQNSSSTSFTMPRSMNLENFGRAQTEIPISSLENQPQDLSMDLSIQRSTTLGSSHNTPHHTNPPSKPNSLPSPHESLPLLHQPTSPCYGSPDYISQTFPHSYFHSSSVDPEDHHMPVYQHQRDSYGCSSPAFSTESYNCYHDHNISHESRLIPQGEAYFNRQTPSGPQSVGLFTSSHSPGYNREQDIFHGQHQVFTHHRLAPDLLEQPQPHLGRHSNRDEDVLDHHHLYASHLDQNEVYTDLSHRQGFPEMPCQVCDSTQLQNFKLSPPQWPHCPSDIPMQTPTYAISQFQHPSPAVTPTLAPASQKVMRPSPIPTPNFDILEAPSPAPIPESIAASRDHNYMHMSNKELHAVLLDAAKNLAHFCVVHRAKSGGFDENRFKDVDSTWEKMMEHFHFHAKCIVRFAKRVPGFRVLKIDDQVVLLRLATYSLVILNHSRAFELETGFYNYFNFTHKEIKRIQELFPEFDVIHSHYKHIGVMAQRLSLTEVEYAYMSCMLLLNEEYPGLEDTERTKQLKERYLEAFQDYELEHFSSGSLRFGQMLLILTEFAQISMEHNVAVGLVITKNSQLHIPQLYAEMYAQGSCVVDNSESAT